MTGGKTLTRAINPMPPEILAILQERGLLKEYEERPPYQKNDYLGWIFRAKKNETREKRVETMLRELATGDLYMGMSYHRKGSRKNEEGKSSLNGLKDLPEEESEGKEKTECPSS